MTASILVETESQKLIMVGKGGAMIKDIGTRARDRGAARPLRLPRAACQGEAEMASRRRDARAARALTGRSGTGGSRNPRTLRPGRPPPVCRRSPPRRRPEPTRTESPYRQKSHVFVAHALPFRPGGCRRTGLARPGRNGAGEWYEDATGCAPGRHLRGGVGRSGRSYTRPMAQHPSCRVDSSCRSSSGCRASARSTRSRSSSGRPSSPSARSRRTRRCGRSSSRSAAAT